MASLKLIVVSAVTFSLLVNSTPAFSVGIPGNATNVATKVAMKKPSAPEVIAIESSATYVKKKKSYVNITVTVTHPASNPTVSSKVVSGGGKSCTIKATKTTCILKQVPLNKSLIVKAKAKNKKGFSKFGLGVVHIAGGAKHPTVAAPASIVQTPASTSPQSPTPTPAPTDPIPTCATGATCALGDTGPGGGLVYYVSSAGFNCGMDYSPTGSPTGGKCHYLEVAPKDWNAIEAVRAPWFGSAALTDDGLDQTPAGVETLDTQNKNLTIGTGYKSSLAIAVAVVAGYVPAGSNGFAAEIAMDYRGGGKTDWYLPSSAELNALCNYSREIRPINPLADCPSVQQDSGFRDGRYGMYDNLKYWSSTTTLDANARPWHQSFGSGEQFGNSLSTQSWESERVRAIRAF
jgi:hypothetical protein